MFHTRDVQPAAHYRLAVKKIFSRTYQVVKRVTLFPGFSTSREAKNFLKIFRESREIPAETLIGNSRDSKNPWDSRDSGNFRENFPRNFPELNHVDIFYDF